MKFKIQAALIIALSVGLTSGAAFSQKVFVDPGHGGPGAGMANGENGGGFNQHRGAVGPDYELTEQWCNLKVAFSLYFYLDAANFEVELSRWDWTEDKSLQWRVNWANNWGADVYLSIHHNGLPLDDQGTETFYCHHNSYSWPECEDFASFAQSRLLDAFGYFNRGYKDDWTSLGTCLYVLRYTEMPAILTEASNIYNHQEEIIFYYNYFNHIEAEAGALFYAIEDYFLYTPVEDPFPPAPPYLLPPEVVNNSIKLSWNPVENAQGYYMYRSTTSGSGYSLIGSTIYFSFTDSNVQPGVRYYYVAQAYNGYGNSSNSNEVNAIIPIPLSATIEGPEQLGYNEVGTFTAIPSGGYPPYDYTWYRKEWGDGFDPKGALGEKNEGGVQPLRPPVGEWVHLSYYDHCQSAQSSGVPPGFSMRVIVTDSLNGSVTVDHDVYVGGFAKRYISGNQSMTTELVKPSSFALFSNYPNPFNPTTEIKYQVPKFTHVSLKIYNLMGQEVRTLVEDEKDIGYYTARWDSKDNSGNDVASGVYIYRIVAGDYTQIRKMTLIR